MPKLRYLSAAAAFLITFLNVTEAGHAAPARHIEPAMLTYPQIAALSPDEQGRILNPLRALAKAADTVGRSLAADVYSGVALDAPSGTVTIYLTDLSRRNGFLKRVRRENPAVDLGSARVRQSRHSLETLTAARAQLFEQQNRDTLRIQSIAVPPDGEALHVRAFDVDGLEQPLATSAAVGLVIEKAIPLSDESRLRDVPQWISGAALSRTATTQAVAYVCTSGLPARRISDNRSFLITAAHCYTDGASVYTGWQNNGRNYIGKVTNRVNVYDAVAVDTSTTGTTASREWDGPPGPVANVLDVSGSDYSHYGDLVCQDGYTSGMACGIFVENQDYLWVGENGVTHRGVSGYQIDGGDPSKAGDSGALVFALVNGSTRQARGIVSGGSDDVNVIAWTEAPPIFTSLGMRLAP